MGVKIFDLVDPQEIAIKELKGKILAVDASLFLHQFLSSIRQPDGSLLKNSKGQVSSHIVGLVARTTKLTEEGLKLCYVFDGTPPELKQKEIERRKELKQAAGKAFEEAKDAGDFEAMKKFKSRTSHLTPEMVEQAKKVLVAMGIPCVQAPSEAEAQAAYMTQQGDAYAVASQDGDTLLFGAKRLIRNLGIAGRKKKAGTMVTGIVQPEVITLHEVLNKNKLTREQLIIIGILIGTDFNPKGVPGIGQQKAMKLIEKHGDNFKELFKEVKWEEHFQTPWQEIREIFLNLPIEKNYELEWKKPNEHELKNILSKEWEFSEERTKKTIERLSTAAKGTPQKGLGDFL